MYTISFIKEALRNGSTKGYDLFQESRGKERISKIKTNPNTKNMAEEINAYAATVPQENWPPITFAMIKEFEISGNRSVYESAYFERRKQLFSLVLAAILEEEDTYIPMIEEKLWQWCELYTWELPAHIPLSVAAIEKEQREPDETVALFAAETAFFFAEILSIIGQKLDNLLVYRIKKEIFRRVIEPFKQQSFWWETSSMNWASVCAGSVGAAAIYLVEEEEELADILHKALSSMEYYLKGFDKDGLITEGLDYWEYGFSFYVHFAELLRERTAGKISLLEENYKIKKIAESPMYLRFPSGSYVNFSDCGSESWNGDCGLFAKLEKALGIQGYRYPSKDSVFVSHTFRWNIMVRKLFWGVEAEQSKAGNVPIGMKHFEESQWLIDRRKTKEGAFVAFAAKGGHNDEPHNHNDLGHFMLHYDGTPMLIDLGAAEYVKQYFRDETRYEFLTTSSIGHSVPVINGCLQKEGKAQQAQVVSCKEENSRVQYKLELKDAYVCKELTKYERTFVWDYNALQLNIADEFQFATAENEVRELFITAVEPRLVEPGKIIIDAKNCIGVLCFKEDSVCTIEREKYKNHQGRDTWIYRITILLKKMGQEGSFCCKIEMKSKNNSTG